MNRITLKTPSLIRCRGEAYGDLDAGTNQRRTPSAESRRAPRGSNPERGPITCRSGGGKWAQWGALQPEVLRLRHECGCRMKGNGRDLLGYSSTRLGGNEH